MTHNSGETDLQKIIKTMNPHLRDERYIILSFPQKTNFPTQISPFARIQEDEGLTVILCEADAIKVGYREGTYFALITLQVHSSLESVGLTAKVSNELAKKGLSVNIVAGYYHDHLLVPFEQRLIAMNTLLEMSAKGSSS